MKASITYQDFEKLDLRVGTIEAATAPDWSRKLLRFEVDFGVEIGKRIIFSGIKDFYTPDEFIGKQYIFITNLEERKMGPEASQGMMMMADGEKPIPLTLPTVVENGCIVR